MVTPCIKGWMHHYIFTDYYLRDERTILLESEIKFLEKLHGPMVVHWMTPIMMGSDILIDMDENSSGGKV